MIKTTGGVYTKVDIIKDAYSQLRINGLTVNPTPEDLELALGRLENMAAEFDSRNIAVNYNFEDNPDPNSITNLNRAFIQAFSTNLAIRLMPDFNKQVNSSLVSQASQSLSNMSARVAADRLQGVQYPARQPIGSGNKYGSRWSSYYKIASPENTNTLKRMYVGDINDYVENFDSYLNDSETISSYSIEVDSGLTLTSDSSTDDDVIYRVEATAEGTSQVTIIVTTSTGRVETRIIPFSLNSAG